METAFDFERWLGLIESLIAAPTWKLIIVAVGIAVICLMYIAKYFYERGKREKEAYLEALKIKRIQDENLVRMQIDAANALLMNMDMAYEQDCQYFTERLTYNDYESIYMKTHAKFHSEIAKIVYNTELAPEIRAAQVIQIIRRDNE